MDLGLTGCTAIVGGASSGMGRAIAIGLAGEGCNVTLFARRRELLDEAAAEIAALGGPGQALVVAGDAAEPADLRSLVDASRERFGRLDILVNNSGGPPAGSFEDFDDDRWRAAWDLVFMSNIRLARLALPALRASGRGRIVNITSSVVKEPSEGLLLSNAYRPGVIGWAKTLSQEEGRHGITVNSIAPGFIDTDRMRELYAGGRPECPRPRRATDPTRPLRGSAGDRRHGRLPLLHQSLVHQRDHRPGGRRRRPRPAQLSQATVAAPPPPDPVCGNRAAAERGGSGGP